MISKKHILTPVFFALLATILIISWFRYGHLYGGGDVGIPSYDPQRIVEIAKYVWWDSAAPGALVPHGVTSLPVQFFQSALVGFGLPYFAVQATVFWIMLFLMGYGMFWVGLLVFGRDKFFLSILCGLFYLLNPYMMIQIWHRFIHNGFFLAAFLPWFYIFWDDWIKRGRFSSIFYFLIFNFFGVYLYGSIAYIATVLLVLFFIFLKTAFIPWRSFNLLKSSISRFLIGIILWILIHAWWMLPTFSIVPALLSTQHGINESVTTLVTLSKQTIIPYTLPGVNPFYLFEQADFGNIYKHPFFLAILWVPLIFLIPGLIISIRSKILASWGLLFIVAGFLAKGAAAPFGFLFIFGISQIFALGVLRNPNEKLGILLPFSLAIIYTVGIKWYLGKFQSKHFRLTAICLAFLLFLQLGVFLWPMWSGRIIGKFDKLAHVEVPNYYQQTDDFLKLQKKDGKILHLPLPQGESIAYNWPFPLDGIESSQLLFSALPSISRGLNIKHIDDSISAASNIFRENVTDEKIIAILKNLNVRFIVLHKDTNWEGGFLDDPQKLEKILDSKRFLEKKVMFGDLVVYEIAEEYFKPRIYATSKVNFLARGEKNSFWPYLLSQNNADLISTINSDDQFIINPLQTIIVPAKTWTFHPQDIPLEKAIVELPAASKILPGDQLYFLIRLKESFRTAISLGPDKLKIKLSLLGKRLVEAVRLKEKGKTPAMAIDSYRKLLSEVFFRDNLKDQVDFVGGRGFIADLFAKHLTILDTLEDSKKAKDELLMALRQSELISAYDVKFDKSKEDAEYATYHFEVPHEDEYELLMADARVRDVYPKRLERFEFEINGEKKEIDGKVVDGFLSYGKIKLAAGRQEIILTATPSANLFTPVEDLIINNNSSFETIIEPLTGDTWYTIKFEASFKLGGKFRLQLIYDGSGVDFDKVYSKDDPSKDWNKYRVGIFFNKPAATVALLKFSVEDNTEVILRNFTVERLLSNPIFLRSSSASPKASTSIVEFTQHSPVYYSGKIELERGGFVIFSEAFHKDWQLKLQSNGKTLIPKERFLANLYANAWFVPPGNYTFELEFTPQRIFYKGLWISFITFLLVTGFYLFKLKNGQKSS